MTKRGKESSTEIAGNEVASAVDSKTVESSTSDGGQRGIGRRDFLTGTAAGECAQRAT